MEYVNENIDMVGVNNRNLGTFHTDVENSFRLAEKLPKEMLWVSAVSYTHLADSATANTVLPVSDTPLRTFLS